jgi:hypothetical protein
VTDVVLSDHSMKIALYDPETEVAKVFDDKEDDASVAQVKSDLLKKMEKTSGATDEERKLKEAKDLVKSLEAEYQAKVEELVNISKYGQKLKKNGEKDKITEADVLEFRKELEQILEDKHTRKFHSVQDSKTPNKSLVVKRSMFFSTSVDADGAKSPEAVIKRTRSPSEDSTGSHSPRISCCAGLFGRPKQKRRPVF